MTAPRCRFCRSTDGDLIREAIDVDPVYEGNLRRHGFTPQRHTYKHAACEAAYLDLDGRRLQFDRRADLRDLAETFAATGRDLRPEFAAELADLEDALAGIEARP